MPQEEYDEILTKCHSSPYGGHFGGEMTIQKVLQCGIFWLTLFKYCHRFVQQCDRCQRLGNITRRNEMPLTNILEVEIFDIWGIDFIDHFDSLLRSEICISCYRWTMYRSGLKLLPHQRMMQKQSLSSSRRTYSPDLELRDAFLVMREAIFVIERYLHYLQNIV